MQPFRGDDGGYPLGRREAATMTPAHLACPVLLLASPAGCGVMAGVQSGPARSNGRRELGYAAWACGPRSAHVVLFALATVAVRAGRALRSGRRCPVRTGMGDHPQPGGRHARCHPGIPGRALHRGGLGRTQGRRSAQAARSTASRPRAGASSLSCGWCRCFPSICSTMRSA